MGRGPKYKAAQPKPEKPKKVCPICGRKFYLPRALNRHMKDSHRQ